MNKRPLAVIAIFFAFGIVIAKFLPDSIKFHHVFILTAFLILSSFIFSKNSLLVLSITSFAALLYINSNILPNNHIINFLEDGKLKTEVVGVIRSPVLTRRPYFGKINSSYEFDVEGQGTRDKRQGVGRIRIQTEKDYRYGDRLFVKGTVKRFRDSFTINTREQNVTVLASDYKSNPILKYIYAIRGKLKDQIIDKMPLDSGAFLRAILLGDRSELPKGIQDSFKNSGTIHVLAISGLHIGIIALMILYLFRLLRLKREFSYILTIIFLIFFALLTLSRPSVVRAVVMASIFLTGMLLGKKVDVYNSLGAAALFILVRNPKDISNIGFQLSFMAVLSILFFTPKFMRLVKEGTNFYIKRFLYTPLAVSISAWLATAPLIWYYFKITTPIAIIANLFIIPGLFALLIGGLSFLLLGWVPFIGDLLAGLNNFLCQVIFFLTTFFANFTF